MNPRCETFCSIDPEDGREFVAILTWFRVEKDGSLFPLSHADFYGSSAREAKERAGAWLEREQAKLDEQKATAEQRAATLQRDRRREIA